MVAWPFRWLLGAWHVSWDVAAGIVLVREAGGFVTDFRRRRNARKGSICAGNEAIHRQLLDLMRKA